METYYRLTFEEREELTGFSLKNVLLAQWQIIWEGIRVPEDIRTDFINGFRRVEFPSPPLPSASLESRSEKANCQRI